MATLADSFAQDGEATAVIIPEIPALWNVTYEQLQAEVTRFQAKLAEVGIQHGDVVSLAFPNTYEFIISFLAATSQRAIAAPLNPAYKQDEFEFYIGDLNSTLALVPQGWFNRSEACVRAARTFNVAIAECYWDGNEIVLDLKERGKLEGTASQKVLKAEPDDIALVLHTSGTTGRPKSVPLTHANLTRTMGNIKATYQLSPSDRTVLVMPLFHVHGLLAAFLAPLHSGGSVVVPARFSASSFWNDFIWHKANWYTAVPTIHKILLNTTKPNPMPEIRFIRSCSSPLAPQTFYELEAAFNAPVLEAYAMTEAAHQMCSNPLPPQKRVPGSVGVGQGVEVKILDQNGDEVPQGQEAEICVRGENVTKGYLNNPAANEKSFTKDGFFRTGDQGKKSPEGYVMITGRIKELINRGGEKISPVELDNALLSHPDIAEAVSFAIPDPHYGETIGVVVVTRGTADLAEDYIKTWMADKVAKFKVPKKIWIMKEIPKTATGKVQRGKVAQAILQAGAACA